MAYQLSSKLISLYAGIPVSYNPIIGVNYFKRMAENKFHIEHSILVTSDSVTATETTRFIEKYVEELVERGEHSRILILSGCHGSDRRGLR